MFKNSILRKQLAYLRDRVISSNFYLLCSSPVKYHRISKLTSKPIIIGGCGRSGTTLLMSILSCHPNIYVIPEETAALCRTGWFGNPKMNLDAPFRLDILYRYLIDNHIPDSCTRWCEKTPSNVLFFERIIRRFGDKTRVINLVRDGRDVITSIHPSNLHRSWVTPQRWIHDVSAGLKVEKHPQILTVRYEDLVLDYETTVRKICSFLDEEFVNDFLTYPESASITQNIAWKSQARPIDPTTIGRWKAQQYAEIVEELLNVPQAVTLLQHYNYITK